MLRSTLIVLHENKTKSTIYGDNIDTVDTR